MIPGLLTCLRLFQVQGKDSGIQLSNMPTDAVRAFFGLAVPNPQTVPAARFSHSPIENLHKESSEEVVRYLSGKVFMVLHSIMSFSMMLNYIVNPVENVQFPTG